MRERQPVPQQRPGRRHRHRPRTDHLLPEGIKRWRIDREKYYPFSRLHEAHRHIRVDVRPYGHKAYGDPDKRVMYLACMKRRKEDGYRAPNRLQEAADDVRI